MGSVERRTAIVSTEAALRYLCAAPSPQVDALLEALQTYGPEAEIVQVRGARRPLWISGLGPDSVVAFTVGMRDGAEEVRIIHAGPRSCELDPIALLAEAAEFPCHPRERPDIERAKASAYPLAPAAVLTEHTLSEYLAPHGQLLEPGDTAEDLGSQRFRQVVFHKAHGDPACTRLLKEPEDSPLRLSQRQKRLLFAPRPLLVQGVAGSGKTTVLCRLAAQQSEADRGQSRILIVAYQPSLKRYIEALLATLDGGGPHSIRVMTYREICEALFTELQLGPISWADARSSVEEIVRFGRTTARLSHDITVPEVLEEIRACIKGACP